MNIKSNKRRDVNCFLTTGVDYSLVLAMLLIISSLLAGCEHHPESLFEQQAEAESVNEIGTRTNTSQQVAVIAPVTSATADNVSLTSINVIKKQTIAKQPNCDPTQADCQYFELNVLEFAPEQPWLINIMWQTIAQMLAPETPLASEVEIAKKTVSMLFNQIAYAEHVVDTLPLYQRIDTELVLNPTTDRRQVGEHTSAYKNELGSADTGYLVIQLSQQRDVKHQQQLSYVMLDMQKKLRLTIDDILLPRVTTDDLLLLFQTAKKDYLALHNSEPQAIDLKNTDKRSIKDGPLLLSQHWYLDDKGLHMVYQAGKLSDMKAGSIDLMVPYTLLQGLIKPRYVVQTSAALNTTQ